MGINPAKTLSAPDFAVRLTKAADANPHFPPHNFGRLRWVVDQFDSRFHVKVSPETVRKWFAGEARPRHEMALRLAELFEVDHAWLTFGEGANTPLSERKLRDAQRSGVVNVVAGVIQMQGGHPAFPEGEASEDVDVFAIIKGAQYNLKVCLGTATDNGLQFALPPKGTKALLIGVVMRDRFCFDFYEIEPSVFESPGVRRGGASDALVAAEHLKPIRTFAERL